MTGLGGGRNSGAGMLDGIRGTSRGRGRRDADVACILWLWMWPCALLLFSCVAGVASTTVPGTREMAHSGRVNALDSRSHVFAMCFTSKLGYVVREGLQLRAIVRSTELDWDRVSSLIECDKGPRVTPALYVHTHAGETKCFRRRCS